MVYMVQSSYWIMRLERSVGHSLISVSPCSIKSISNNTHTKEYNNLLD